MRYRVLVIVAAAVVAAAAPARAWCEASCMALVGSSQSHCPSPEPVDSGAQISANAIDECPILESARPPGSARLLDVHAASVFAALPELKPQPHLAFSTSRPNSASTVFERCTPLRV